MIIVPWPRVYTVIHNSYHGPTNNYNYCVNKYILLVICYYYYCINKTFRVTVKIMFFFYKLFMYINFTLKINCINSSCQISFWNPRNSERFLGLKTIYFNVSYSRLRIVSLNIYLDQCGSSSRETWKLRLYELKKWLAAKSV